MSELKLASYNIYDGYNRDNIIENILNFAEQGVNFFCLQEVRSSETGDFIGDVLLQKLGSGWQSEYFVATVPSSDYGLAMYWRKDILSPLKFETVSLAKLDFLSLFEQLIEYAQGNRTQPIQRGALAGTFMMDGKVLRITNIHLDWHGGKKHRLKQLKQLVDHLKKMPPVNSEVVCGDFNTVSFVGTDSHLKEIHMTLGEDFFNSIPEIRSTARLGQHLDHIFARNLKLQEAKIQEVVGSDHYPVIASLKF